MSQEIPTPFVSVFMRCAYCLELEVLTRPGPTSHFHSHVRSGRTRPLTSPKKKYEFDDYIFTIPMEVNGKNTTELEHKDVFEEYYMTTYVKTISCKTIRIKCDKKQQADTVSKKNNEMRTAIPRGLTYLTHQGKMLKNKSTIKENNIEAESTIEMSLRLLGGMDESDMKDSSETEEEREKRESWKKRVKANRRERAKNQYSNKEK